MSSQQHRGNTETGIAYAGDDWNESQVSELSCVLLILLLCTLGSGLWALDSGLWPLASGFWLLPIHLSW